MKTYIIYEYDVDESTDYSNDEFNTPIDSNYTTSDILTLNNKQNVMDYIEDNLDLSDKQKKSLKIVFNDKDVHVFYKKNLFLSFICKG